MIFFRVLFYSNFLFSYICAFDFFFQFKCFFFLPTLQYNSVCLIGENLNLNKTTLVMKEYSIKCDYRCTKFIENFPPSNRSFSNS